MNHGCKRLLQLAGIKPDDLVPFADVERPTIYRHLAVDPPPIWLLESFSSWYAANKPLKPEYIDVAFRSALYDLWPKPPVDPGSARGKGKQSRFSRGGNISPVKVAPHQKSAHRIQLVAARLDARTLNVVSAPISEPDPIKESPAPDLDRAAKRGVEFSPFPTPALFSWSSSDLSDEARAVRLWRDLSCMQPLPRGVMDAFIEAIITQRPTWMGAPTRGAIVAKLRRASGTRLRARTADDQLSKRKEALARFTLGYVAQIEGQGHSKGAYQRRSWMSFRPALESLLDVGEWRQRADEILGRDVNLPLLERIFRPLFGGLSPMERAAEDYMQRTLGFRAEYAGQVVQIDGSELPVNVLNGWGRARKDGDLAQTFLVCTDMDSLRSMIYREASTSEVHLYDPALQEWLFRLGFAPEMTIGDEIGRAFNALRYLKEGEAPTLTLGVRLWLAAGVKPYCHKPGNPRGKAAVESGGVKSFKNVVKRFLSARWVAKELAGCAPYYKGAADYRTVESESDWRGMLQQCEQALNNKLLQRAGLTRQETWDSDELGVQKRNERALAPDARETFREICNRARVWQVAGNTKLLARHNGQKAFADLLTPLPDSATDRLAVMFPAGLRAGDEKYGGDLWRGVVVQDRAGQPTYHAIEALYAKRSHSGVDLSMPTIHDHVQALPEREHERKLRAWRTAARPAAEVREATNDSVLKSE